MKYKIVIKLLEKVEYDAIVGLDNKNAFIRTEVDHDQYEEMFWQLLTEGYLKIINNEKNEKIIIEEYNNNFLEIFKKLKRSGIDISWEEID